MKNINFLIVYLCFSILFNFYEIKAQCELTIDPDLSGVYDGCVLDATLPGSLVSVTNPTTDNTAVILELFYDTDPAFDPYAGGGTLLTGYETGPFINAFPLNTGCEPIIYYLKGAWVNYIGTDCEAEAPLSITSTLEVVRMPDPNNFVTIIDGADPCVDAPTIDLGACAGSVTATGPNGFVAGNTGIACWDLVFSDPGVTLLPTSCLTINYCDSYTCLGQCPAVVNATGNLNVCEGDPINLSATIDPLTAVENQDYFLEWYSDGTAIPNTVSVGPDGQASTADDISAVSISVPGDFDIDPGCGYEENQIEVSLYCLQNAELRLAMTDDPCPSGTAPNCVYTYVASGTCFDLDLSGLPACALATEFFFNVQGVSGTGANGDSYGTSYACEANIEVNTPTGTLSFCGSGDGTGCGSFNPGCDGTQGVGSWGNAETYTFGYPSVQPASGLWQICVSDAFDDSGGGAEGEVQVVDLVVDWYLPPGCDLNNGVTYPVTDANGAPTPTRVCADLVNGVDYTVTIGCTGEVTGVCPDGGSVEILYSADGSAGSYTSLSPILNSPPADGDIVYYQVRIPGCDDCLVQDQVALTTCPVPCPQLQTATVTADNCAGGSVALSATVDTGVENQDYFLIWYEDGVAIPNAASYGADAIPGTADDVSVLSYNHIIANANGACGVEVHEYHVELYCLDDPVLDLQPTDSPCPSGTTPNCIYQYDPGPINFNLDLTALPACALVTSYDYSLTGTTDTGLNGDSYGVSYACEANITVNEPAGSVVYCGTGAGTGCGGFNPGCDGPAGAADYGTSGSATYPFGTGPGAAFNWGIVIEDAFNDPGIDGEIQTLFFKVNYYLPPGCDRNAGNVLVATNIDVMANATVPANGGTADFGGANTGSVSGVTVCTLPVLNTDYTLPTSACNPAVTLNCTAYAGDPVNDVGPGLAAGAAVLYSTDGGTTYTSTNPYDAVSITATDDSDRSDLVVEYQVFQPACPACANVTGTFTLVYPDAPTNTSDASFCVTASLTATCTGAGETITWYATSGGTAEGTGSPYTPAVSGTAGSYTYYVTCTDANGCESAETTVTFTIDAQPTAIIGTCPTDVCFGTGGTVNLMPSDSNAAAATNGAATGAWSGSAAAFVTADAIDMSTIPVGTYDLTYTLTSVNGDCTDAADCSFEIFDAPAAAPTLTNETICFGAVVPNLVVTAPPAGSTYNVYSADGLTQLIAGAASPIDVSSLAMADLDNMSIGIYTLNVTEVSADGCESPQAAVTIEVESCADVSITDPCTCNDDQTLNISGDGEGTFGEVVTLTGNTTGETWTVTAITANASGSDSTMPIGIAVGDVLAPAIGNDYSITFDHADGAGYTVQIEGPGAVGDAGNESLTIGNVCIYPEVVTPFLADTEFCVDEAVSMLAATGSDSDGNAGTYSYLIDGTAVTLIDPANLGAGSYTLNVTFTGTPINDDINAGPPNPAYPGCASVIDVPFIVHPLPDASFTCPTMPVPQCDGNVALAPVDATGTWSGSGASFINLVSNEFEPVSAPVGIDLTIIYTVTDVNGCTDSVECTFQVVNNCAANGGSFGN